jgi:hypothetical protein
VLIRGEKGTAKSTAVRALTEILPPVDVVPGCRFSCDPEHPDDTSRRASSFGYRHAHDPAGAARPALAAGHDDPTDWRHGKDGQAAFAIWLQCQSE